MMLRRPRKTTRLVDLVPDETWEVLSTRERNLLLSLDDHLAGRFGLVQFADRLAGHQALEADEAQLARGVAVSKLERIARLVQEGDESGALAYVRVNLLGEPVGLTAMCGMGRHDACPGMYVENPSRVEVRCPCACHGVTLL